jgi:hypothetical protein
MKIVLFIVAVVVGIIAVTMTVALVESVGHRLDPPPAGMQEAGAKVFEAFQSGDQAALAAAREELGALVAQLPTRALLIVALGWILASAVGAGIAALIARSGKIAAAAVVTGINLCLIGLNLFMIPHPGWMPVVGLGGALIAGLATGICVDRRCAKRAVPA